MAERETKRINGRFLTRPVVGDLVVNADRQTNFIPCYRVMKVNGRSVHLSGVERSLDFIVRVVNNARHSFKLKE